MPFSQLGPDSKVNFTFGNRAYPINPLLSNISKFSFRAEESSRFPISFYEQLDSESYNSSLSYKEPPSFAGEELHNWAGRGMPGHSSALASDLPAGQRATAEYSSSPTNWFSWQVVFGGP